VKYLGFIWFCLELLGFVWIYLVLLGFIRPNRVLSEGYARKKLKTSRLPLPLPPGGRRSRGSIRRLGNLTTLILIFARKNSFFRRRPATRPAARALLVGRARPTRPPGWPAASRWSGSPSRRRRGPAARARGPGPSPRRRRPPWRRSCRSDCRGPGPCR
jgi:hypothetical protein